MDAAYKRLVAIFRPPSLSFEKKSGMAFSRGEFEGKRGVLIERWAYSGASGESQEGEKEGVSRTAVEARLIGVTV